MCVCDSQVMGHKSVPLIKVHAPADTTAALIYNKHSVGGAFPNARNLWHLHYPGRYPGKTTERNEKKRKQRRKERKFSSKQKPLDMSGHKNACRWLAAMQIKIKCKVGKNWTNAAGQMQQRECLMATMAMATAGKQIAATFAPFSNWCWSISWDPPE